MANIRNRFDIEYELEEDIIKQKKLPNYFIFDDELPHWKGFIFSITAHIVFIFLAMSLQVLVFSHLPKPKLPSRDVVFKLVQNEEKPPINKKTPIRSDKNSQAGGKHDPKKTVSEPGKMSNTAKKAVQQAAKPKQKESKPKQHKQPVQKTSQQSVQKSPQKPVQKPVQKTYTAPTPIAKKPSPAAAPSAAKPAVKPAVKPQVLPSAPKIAAAPKSPFAVPVAPSNAPVGTTYKSASNTLKQGASSGSGGTSYSGTPAPKFSSSYSGSGNGSNGSGSKTAYSGSYGSRGSGGGNGSGNNPSPGNPNGTPGIDAIRQPNWGPYMRDLEQRIKRNWFPPKGDSSKRVIITFTIAKDGRLLSKKITKSSGVPLADQAALRAIESTAPFRPLPPEFRGTSVPIEFTFDYNVLNSVLR